MNFEAVTARYADVRLERKKEALDAYHGAVEKAAPAQAKEADAKKERQRKNTRKWSFDRLIFLPLLIAFYIAPSS